MGQARQNQQDLQKAAMHWVSVSKLLLYTILKPGETTKVTRAQMNQLDADFPKGHEIICQPNQDGSIDITLVSLEEARKRVAADQAKHRGGRNDG